jgi:hypothetical protein
MKNILLAISLLAVFSCGKDTAIPVATGNGIKFKLSDATNIAQNSVSLAGLITAGTSAPNITSRGYCLDTVSHPTGAYSLISSGTGTGNVNVNLINLYPGETYYVRGFYKISTGTFYGNEIQFTTLPASLATVTTTTVSSITRISAVGYGSVTATGGGVYISKGICWSASTTTPTIANSFASGGNGTGSYSVNLTNLAAATTYYVRAYVTNEAGTAYGTMMSFKTLN